MKWARAWRASGPGAAGEGRARIRPRRTPPLRDPRERWTGKRATLTGVIPPGRYGSLSLDGDKITRFIEKPPGDNTLINGGFFVLQPDVVDMIEGDQISWEAAPLENLAASGELMAYRHSGFWQPMDTLRDKNHLEQLWAQGKAPWKVWA